MEKNKKLLVSTILISLLSLSVVPYVNVSAQSCNPDKLVPVSYGQRGAAVRNAQACLIEAGYDIPAGATGYYGSQTRNAVRQFYADWYGSWHGNNLGPRGVAQLKEMLTSAGEEEQQPTEEQPTQQPTSTPSVDANTLLQIVALILAGQRDAALALLQGLGVSVPTTTQPTEQPTTAEEGLLFVEKNPTPASGQQFREGESVTWVGVKFTAQDSDIRVKSFKLVWPTGNGVAPQRMVAEFQVVDDQGNVLKTVPASSFTQDNTTLDYYYYVTGLDYLVSKGTSRPIFVKATAVSTFPAGFPSSLTLQVSDVRGRDNAGIDRFPSTVVTNSVTPQATLATAARFDVSRNPNSPLEDNVLADVTTQRADNVEMLRFDLLARNDRVKLMEVRVSVSVTGAGSVPTVYLKDSAGNTLASAAVSSGVATFTNLSAQNIWVEKDQTRTFSVHADVTGATTTDTTVQVTLTSLKRQNSLGDVAEQPNLGVAGDPMHFFTVAPVFAKGSTFNVAVTRDQNNSTTTANATLEVLITAKGGEVRVSATSSPFALLWETNTGVTRSVNVNVSEVRDSSGNLVTAQNNLYVIPVNQTYKFTLQNQQTFSGAPRVRVTVNGITWNNGNNVTSTFVKRFLVTDWSN